MRVSSKTGLDLPHVRWEETKDRIKSNLVPHHLIRHLSVSQLTGVLVGPSMAGNLVAFCMHSLERVSVNNWSKSLRGQVIYPDNRRIGSSWVVNHSFTDVVARNEKGGLGPIALCPMSAVIIHDRVMEFQPSTCRVDRWCRGMVHHQMSTQYLRR